MSGSMWLMVCSSLCKTSGVGIEVGRHCATEAKDSDNSSSHPRQPLKQFLNLLEGGNG